MARSPYIAEQRAEALDLYKKHGAAEAHRRTAIPLGTIKTWAHRAGETDSRRATARGAIESARLTWAQNRAEACREAGQAALDAARAVREAIGKGHSRSARDYAAAHAALVGTAQLLDGAATGRVEHMRPEEAVRELHKLRDELAARRQAKAAAG